MTTLCDSVTVYLINVGQYILCDSGGHYGGGGGGQLPPHIVLSEIIHCCRKNVHPLSQGFSH